MHEDVASGAKNDRAGLRSITAALGPGDALVVARLDRLTRSLLQFAGLVEDARSAGWSLVVVDQGFDRGTPAGRAMAGMCAVFAASGSGDQRALLRWVRTETEQHEAGK